MIRSGQMGNSDSVFGDTEPSWIEGAVFCNNHNRISRNGRGRDSLGRFVDNF